MKRESWQDIPGYEGLYQASSLGRIRSLDRITISRNGRQIHLRGRVLKQSPDSCEYLRVNLYKDFKRENACVHVIVCRTFSGPRPAAKHARHLDGVKANCRSGNLVWGTKSQNQMDRAAHGTSNRGERCGNAKLTRRQIRSIRMVYGRGDVSYATLATKHEVNKGTIGKIVRRTLWGWLS